MPACRSRPGREGMSALRLPPGGRVFKAVQQVRIDGGQMDPRHQDRHSGDGAGLRAIQGKDMKDIKELALKVAKEMNCRMDEMTLETFATRLIAAYLKEQEPVAWIYCPECGSEEIHYEEGRYKQCANCHQEWFSDIDYSDVVQSNLSKLFTAPPEPAQNLYREIYEVWAGSEGIPMPRTAPEAYLLGLLEQMVDIAKTGMHMTEPAPQTDGSTTVSAPDQERMSRSACAAPSSEEVGQTPDTAGARQNHLRGGHDRHRRHTINRAAQAREGGGWLIV